ncbi:MAG: TldD/PmbA family protein [Rhodospirillales bacterium]|nr:TldD/PmbA family protein [Rhodospirillales bacterium]
MTDEERLGLLDDLIKMAKTAGADAADAVYVEGISVSLACRMGKTEHLERSEGADLGLRVFKGKQQACVSSSDVSPDALGELVERAVAMAKNVPEDPHCGIADPDQLASGGFPDLDMVDPLEASTDVLKERALEAEDAARAVKGVTNTEGSEASWGKSSVALATSNGFTGTRSGSRSGVSVSVLAGEGTGMERDYDYTSAVFAADLTSPAELGVRAGEKAVKRLNPRQIDSAQLSVVFDPRVSDSIIGHLSGAINGSSIARGTSFLKDSMGKKLFPDNITIVDDPHRVRGLRSKEFDGEGLTTKRRNIIENGELKTWIMNLSSARQLGLQSTGHASRGTSAPPGSGVTNFYMEPGDVSPAELMADIKSGLYVTEMIGMGVNTVTGDYSRGATGFWIENGEIAFPVSEITIASNLSDMFANLNAADDLEFRHGTDAPTLRIDTMAIAGK